MKRKNAGILVTLRRYSFGHIKIPLTLVGGVSCLLAFVYSDATPLITSRGTTLPAGKNEVSLSLNYNPFTGKYDDGGNFSEFKSGESRNSYNLLLNLNYGSTSDSEIDLMVPYIYKSHTKINGERVSCLGVGDIYLIGKNKVVDNSVSKGFLSVSLGVKFPTGKSIFNVEKDTLPSGTGTWDILVGMHVQEKRAIFLLYGDVTYSYRFGVNSDTFGGYNVLSIKYTPGAILNYNFAVEYPLINLASLLLELNGAVYYESKAEYAASGLNAANDLIALDVPEYILQRGHSLKLTPGAKIYLGEYVSFGIGAGIPISAGNVYGGISYFVNVGIIM